MLRDEDWQTLIDSIKRKQCTPFLGAGASSDVLPLGKDIAARWASDFGYPFADKTNLISVSQYVALKRDRIWPKHRILDEFKTAASPQFSDLTEPHRGLADLRLPIYITTNYDPFMTEALKFRELDPEREFYRWNKYLRDFLGDSPSIFERQPDYSPSPARPLVFHLHGNEQTPDSLVLIEDDYIEFLINTSQAEYALPLPIKRALVATSMLFVGYSIADWNFRVLLGSLNNYKSVGSYRLNVAVMPLPKGNDAEVKNIEDYLTRYYRELNVVVHWSSARSFLQELRRRME